jgi:hypothetical protein
MARADTRDRGEASQDPDRLPSAAALRALALFALIVLGVFYVPQWIVTDLPHASRTLRVWLATAWTGAFFVGLCAWSWRATTPRASEGERDAGGAA